MSNKIVTIEDPPKLLTNEAVQSIIANCRTSIILCPADAETADLIAANIGHTPTEGQ